MVTSRASYGHSACSSSIRSPRITNSSISRVDVDGVEDYLRRIGADPMLYTRGASEHGRVLDHFRDHDIDYQVIVGGGG